MAVYGPHLVRDENNAPAQGASGKLYAPDDTSFTTPLTMTALGTGAAVVDWIAGADGQLGTVNVESVNHPYLWYKPNGNVPAQQVLSFDSLQGIKDDANASAASAAASASAAQAAQAAAESLEAGVADWDALQNKPGVFPPAPHSHAAADIASGTVAPQRLGTGTRDGSRYLRDDGTWQVPPGTGGGGGGASSWDELLGKPSTFPPSSHSHPASQISDSSPLGRTVLTTSDPITARNAIGAGTSSVTVGGSTTGAAAPASHTHTKAQVGLGNVDNTADADKPVSVAMAAALSQKVSQASLDAVAQSRPQIVIVQTGSESRPSGSTVVLWIGGSVQPTNMAASDVWLSEAA